MVGGDIDCHEGLALAAHALQRHFAGEEAEAVGALLPVGDEDELLEGHLIVRREGVQELLHGGVDVPEDGDPEEKDVEPSQDPPPHHVGGEDPHEQDEEDGDQEPQPWDVEREGQDRYTTEIIVNEMKMLGGKSAGNNSFEVVENKSAASSSGSAAAPAKAAPAGKNSFDNFDDDIPF